MLPSDERNDHSPESYMHMDRIADPPRLLRRWSELAIGCRPAGAIAFLSSPLCAVPPSRWPARWASAFSVHVLCGGGYYCQSRCRSRISDADTLTCRWHLGNGQKGTVRADPLTVGLVQDGVHTWNRGGGAGTKKRLPFKKPIQSIEIRVTQIVEYNSAVVV